MGLFDRSFLITTGITAVICGAILYYVNTRMRELEISLAKQNQVLSSFIANVQQEFRMNSSRQEAHSNVNSLASDEAIQFVESMEKEKLNGKIVVSDSESDSDDESISDDESVSDNESVSDEGESQNKLVICDLTQHSDDIKVIELNAKVQTPNTSVNTSSLEEVYGFSQVYGSQVYGSQVYTPERISDDESDDESDESEADTEYEHVSNKVHVEEIHVEKLDVEKLDIQEIPVELNIVKDEQVKKTDKINLNDLKVDDLRKLALDKGLTTKEEVKKLKKNELLALLKK